MSSELQKQASRENGAKSRGPHSLDHLGGHNSRHNMLARTIVLEGESRERFLALVDSLIAELRPCSAIENCLIETMAVARWRQMRIWGMEKAELTLEIDQQPPALNPSAVEDYGDPAVRYIADTPAGFQTQDPAVTPASTGLLPGHAADPPVDPSINASLQPSSVHSKRDAPTRAALALRNVTLRGRSFELMNRYETRYDRQFHAALNRFFHLREQMKISIRTQELVE